MIPQNSYPTVLIGAGEKNYSLHGDRMGALTSGLEALKGWIKLALSTERYAYPIFSQSFGVEYHFGQNLSESALIAAITDALSVDDRILKVDGFTVTREGGKVSAAFTVHSVYGAFETEESINV